MMATLEDAEDTLRSTNSEACAENRSRMVELAGESTAFSTERQLDELKKLREDLIRLQSEFGVCKRVAEDQLEDMRKLTASAEESKDELRRELERSKLATKRHLEEMKQLAASAEREKDELRKELEDSKRATKRYLDELKKLKVSSWKEQTKHKENVDPSQQPIFNPLKKIKLKGVTGIYPSNCFEDGRSLDRCSMHSEASLLHRSFASDCHSSLLHTSSWVSKSSLTYRSPFPEEYQDLAVRSCDWYSGNYRSRQGCSLTSLSSDPQQNQEKIIIDEHPKSQKRNEGSRAEFEFKVQGTNPLSYQWFRDGVELLGQNNASLILECVELQDFGCYACRVSYQVGNDETMEMSSRPAVLDVIPQCLNGLRTKLLQEVDLNTRDEISCRLENRRYSLGGWRQIAAKYGMQENRIAALNNSREPGKDVMEFLSGSKPDLTVYSFFKVLKEDKIERFDIAKLLEPHLLIRDGDSFV